MTMSYLALPMNIEGILRRTQRGRTRSSVNQLSRKLLRTLDRLARVLELSECLGLDLSNPLARNRKLLAHFLQRVVAVHAETKGACVRFALRVGLVTPERAS